MYRHRLRVKPIPLGPPGFLTNRGSEPRGVLVGRITVAARSLGTLRVEQSGLIRLHDEPVHESRARDDHEARVGSINRRRIHQRMAYSTTVTRETVELAEAVLHSLVNRQPIR